MCFLTTRKRQGLDMAFTTNILGQVKQLNLPKAKALWPLFETIVNSIQSLEDTDVDEPTITINAVHENHHQVNMNGNEEPSRFTSFTVTDNGEGFTKRNYNSFLEVFSDLKIAKGCKGIGRFLWLKAFRQVNVESIFIEDGIKQMRRFCFDLKDLISPENNLVCLDEKDTSETHTTITLEGLLPLYQEAIAYSLESLAKKIIEHCLPYFVMCKCPKIILRDNEGGFFDLNKYYQDNYQDSLHRDDLQIANEKFILYHMMVHEGPDKHELHFCANNREVTSYDLSKYIPNLEKKIMNEGEGSFYYIGYLTGNYLDQSVNTERIRFEFSDVPLVDGIGEKDLLDSALSFIRTYLHEDLERIDSAKRERIDTYVHYHKPQYRYLLNHRPDTYEKIPVGLSDDRLDMELYKHEQEWEAEIAQQGAEIESHVRDGVDFPNYDEVFQSYCASVTQLSQASLAEYIVRRKTVIDILEKALCLTDDGKYSREAQIHSIICPMQKTSDQIPYDDMNLWLVDDRLAYHHFLASDRPFKSLPILDSSSPDRMDIAVFDQAISYSSDPDALNSVTIIELKRPQRNDLTGDEKSPISQVYRYISEIKAGRVKRANGRNFGNVTNAAFYCYIIADLTPSMEEAAVTAGLTRTPDNEGFFGFNPTHGAYVEVISYDKLLKDAKKRNQILFDRLFTPKADNVTLLPRQ